ncbi:MAG TPA: YajQ family cyclic di-GMP-binding protein [Verrucomicrobiales bacterium]|nr:YajQ family cyclic di-GMP-binding protein [Verrucomicrobiales bacterium]
MPSFDIVSKVNTMELDNAINQARKELLGRFDFRGVRAEIAVDKFEITLTAQDQFKLRALEEIVVGKLAKRGISPKCVDRKEPEISSVGHGRQVIKIKDGLDSTVAKEVAFFVRETKLKVTTQIQGDEVRVSGKSRDDLQSVIAAIRGHEFPADLQFINFRD